MPLRDYIALDDLEDFKDLVEDTFGATFRLMRETTVSDNEGGFINTDVLVASGPCRLRPKVGGNERVVAAGLGFQTPCAVDFHPDVDLRRSDRLIVDGRLFEIGSIVRGDVVAMTITAICQEVG